MAFSADDFASHLEVDRDGLVVTYLIIARRIAPVNFTHTERHPRAAPRRPPS